MRRSRRSAGVAPEPPTPPIPRLGRCNPHTLLSGSRYKATPGLAHVERASIQIRDGMQSDGCTLHDSRPLANVQILKRQTFVDLTLSK